MARKHAGVKALRQSKKRALKNRAQKDGLKAALKKVTSGNVSQIQALIDKAVKKHLIHGNKAARLKARLMKKLGAPSKTQKTVNRSKKIVKK